MDNLTEVSERAATGRVERIYADIRATLGTSFVNLVYRHLATEPVLLDWAWHAIRPHLVTAALHDQAARLRQHVAREAADWPRLPRSAAAAKPPEAAADIARLIGMYNSANSLNLMALTHLLGRSNRAEASDAGIAGGEALPLHVQVPVPDTLAPRNAASTPTTPTTPTTPATPTTTPTIPTTPATPTTTPTPATPGPDGLPDLPQLDALDDDQRARIARLNGFAEPDAPSIVASLYRHLAAWPDALAFAEAVLAPLEHARLLTAARSSTNRCALRLCASQPLAMPPAPHEFLPRFGATLTTLSSVTISKMLPIGAALAAAVEPQFDHAHTLRSGRT
jgi:hypothetical protein